MKTKDNVLVNRVANSKLKTINLEKLYPDEDIEEFDLKPFLFQGLVLREKDFRAALKEIDWSIYQDKIVVIYCSTDAIIPTWAFMLVTTYFTPYASRVFMGRKEEFVEAYFREILAALDVSIYEDQLIVIKGCSDKTVPISAYVDLTARLVPVARSVMFGEACSTVPIYKKSKTRL